jgi:hypothetical protein
MHIRLHAGSRPAPPAGNAFTLLEVMIAAGIFFVAIFAILELVFSTIHNARMLQEAKVNAGLVAADVYYQTNKWEEGSDSGDFGELYPNYKWETGTVELLTNGFYKVDFVIIHPNGDTETNLSAFFWRMGQSGNSPNPLPRPR